MMAYYIDGGRGVGRYRAAYEAPCHIGKRSAGAYASRHNLKGLLNPAATNHAAMGEAYSREDLPYT